MQSELSILGVESVVVEIWQADSSGEYDPPENQNYAAISWDYTHPSGTGDYKCRAQVRTDNTGAFTFRTGMNHVSPNVCNAAVVHKKRSILRF